MWRVLWTARVLDWQKPFPHSWHLKGFSLEWMYLQREATAGVSGAAGTAGGDRQRGSLPQTPLPSFLFLKIFRLFLRRTPSAHSVAGDPQPLRGARPGELRRRQRSPSPGPLPGGKAGGVPASSPHPKQDPASQGGLRAAPSTPSPQPPPSEQSAGPRRAQLLGDLGLFNFFLGGVPAAFPLSSAQRSPPSPSAPAPHRWSRRWSCLRKALWQMSQV